MLLTEQEIKEIHSFPWERTVDFVRRIESAVLEKLKSQGPFGYFKAEPFGWTDCAETDDGAKPLYEHPLPPADVARDAERYRWITECPRVPWGMFLPDDALVKVGIDAAIDAAMKEKS